MSAPEPALATAEVKATLRDHLTDMFAAGTAAWPGRTPLPPASSEPLHYDGPDYPIAAMIHGHQRHPGSVRGWWHDERMIAPAASPYVVAHPTRVSIPAEPSSESRWFTHTTTPPRPGIMADTPGATDAHRILVAACTLIARHGPRASRMHVDECHRPNTHTYDGWECLSCRPLGYHCRTCHDTYGDPVPFPCPDYEIARALIGNDL